jgi:hypothetical protein
VEILERIDTISKALGFITKLSQLEMAIDFFGPIYALRQFFVDHLFLKHHRSECRVVGNGLDSTFYIGDTRTGAKAVRLYPKDIGEREILRLELVLNRPLVRNLGVELPLKNINHVDPSKFLCFKKLNKEKLVNHMIWRHKEKTNRQARRGTLQVRLFENWASIGGPLMQQVIRIKRSQYGRNYGRFFEDMEDCNETFYDLVENQSFLQW